MNIADMLLDIKNEYNGHKQTVIEGLSVEDGLDILRELNDHCGVDGLFSLRVFNDDEFSIYQEDYWKPGEHMLGHKDRLIMSNS